MTQPSKVLADGCFDPLHVGHVAYLEAAAALGELYVHVASDAEIRKKGRESFQLQPERCRTVRALKCVADVFVHPTLKDAILRLQPRVLVKGRDWIGKLPHDVVAACREAGTVIVYTDTQERTSTERLYQHTSGPPMLTLDPKVYRALNANKGCGVKGCWSCEVQDMRTARSMVDLAND